MYRREGYVGIWGIHTQGNFYLFGKLLVRENERVYVREIGRGLSLVTSISNMPLRSCTTMVSPGRTPTIDDIYVETSKGHMR